MLFACWFTCLLCWAVTKAAPSTTQTDAFPFHVDLQCQCGCGRLLVIISSDLKQIWPYWLFEHYLKFLYWNFLCHDLWKIISAWSTQKSARSCNGFFAAHEVCSVTFGMLITWQYLASVNWRNIAWLSSVMSFTACKQLFFFKRYF